MTHLEVLLYSDSDPGRGQPPVPPYRGSMSAAGRIGSSPLLSASSSSDFSQEVAEQTRRGC